MTKTFLAHLVLAANLLIPASGTAQWVENDTVFVMLQSGRKMAISPAKPSPPGPAAMMPGLSIERQAAITTQLSRFTAFAKCVAANPSSKLLLLQMAKALPAEFLKSSGAPRKIPPTQKLR